MTAIVTKCMDDFNETKLGPLIIGQKFSAKFVSGQNHFAASNGAILYSKNAIFLMA